MLQEHCGESLQTVSLIDLANPIKKATIEQICSLMAVCGEKHEKSSGQVALVIERC